MPFKFTAEIYLSAIGAAFLLVLADLMANLDAATTLKIGTILNKYILETKQVGEGVIGLVLVLAVSAFTCWLRSPENKGSAFTVGLSVFSVLNVAAPYSKVDKPKGEPEIIQTTPHSSNPQSPTGMFLISTAFAQQANTKPTDCVVAPLVPNAKLLSSKTVSSCQPYYAGPLGLSSLFNNTMNFCATGHRLSIGDEVEYLSSWETTLRGYRYAQIKYRHDGKVCTGWISDGRADDRTIEMQ